jgi:hypothetical protein
MRPLKKVLAMRPGWVDQSSGRDLVGFSGGLFVSCHLIYAHPLHPTWVCSMGGDARNFTKRFKFWAVAANRNCSLTFHSRRSLTRPSRMRCLSSANKLRSCSVPVANARKLGFQPARELPAGWILARAQTVCDTVRMCSASFAGSLRIVTPWSDRGSQPDGVRK